MFKVPKPLPLPYWQTPYLPFPGYIWAYVIGSFLFGAVTLFIINVVKKIINKKLGTVEQLGHKTYGFFDSIFAVFMISMFHSVEINTHYFSNVTIFMAIIIYALVIGNLYCGKLHVGLSDNNIHIMKI